MKKYFSIYFLFFIQVGIIKSQTIQTDFTGSTGITSINYANTNSGFVNNVNLSLGLVNPSIPITEIRSGNLSVQLSLSYGNSNGIAINQIASNVGLGWNLNAGGYIKRTVRGKRDDLFYGSPQYPTDQPNMRGWLDLISDNFSQHSDDALYYYSNNQNVGQLIKNDYLWNIGSYPGNNAFISEARAKVYFQAMHHHPYLGEIDTEPDLFEFSLGNLSGSFIFDESGQPVLIPYLDIKIIPALGPNAQTSWVITTDDGIRYIFINNFAYKELTKSVMNTGIDDIMTTPENESLIETEYVSTWYLSRIENDFGDWIQFNYTSDDEYNFDFEASTASQYYGPTTIDNGFDINASVPPLAIGFPPYFDQTGNQHIKLSYSKSIESIWTSNSKILFVKETSSRSDLNGSHFPYKFIKQFTLEDGNQTLQREFQFNYSYFKQCVSSIKLKLLSFQENCISNCEPHLYRFVYEGNDEPISAISRREHDIWGFYNTNNSNHWVNVPEIQHYDSQTGLNVSLSGFTTSIDLDRLKLGVLKEIIFPSGSSAEYQYEGNSGAGYSVGGLRIKKIIMREKWSQNHTVLPSDKVTEYIYNDAEVDYENKYYKINKMFAFQIDFPAHPYTEFSYSKYFITRRTNPRIYHSRDYLRYTKVEEKIYGQGRTEYQFTGFTTNPDLIPAKYYHFYNVPTVCLPILLLTPPNETEGMKTDLSFERGLLMKSTIYDELGNKLKEITHTYDFNPAGFVPKEVVGLAISNRNYFRIMTTTPPVAYELEFYKYIAKLNYLISTTEKTFDPSDPNKYLSITSEFSFDSPNHKKISSIRKAFSDGTEEKSYFKYVKDFSEAHVNFFIADNNCEGIRQLGLRNINVPLFSMNTRKKSGVEYVIDGNLTTFNSDATPHQYFTFDKNKPFEISSLNDIQNMVYVDNAATYFLEKNSHFKLKTTNIAFFQNKIIETLNEAGMHQSQILDPEKSFIKATFNNASVSGQECDIFDFEGNSNSYANTLLINESHTGYKCNRVSMAPDHSNGDYSYSFGKTFYPTNQSQKYKVSAWIRTPLNYGNTSVHKGELVIRAVDASGNSLNLNQDYQAIEINNTNNEWKFFQVILDYPFVKSQSNMVAGFSVYAVNYNETDYYDIDDVRIQPEYSECVSSTYDRQTGQTSSVSDQRSIPTYYEFDSFGNSTVSRNSSLEIIREQYSITDNQMCEYWNDDRYACARKNNCAMSNPLVPDSYHGFYGSEVIYYIPAMKYSSCIDQNDVSSQVNNELVLNLQNYANANGDCLPCFDMDQYLYNNNCYDAVYVFDYDEPCDNDEIIRHYHYDYPAAGAQSVDLTVTIPWPCDPGQ